MKILYCLDGTYNSGGKERIVISKANSLAAKGHRVVIVTSEQVGRPDYFPLQNVRRIDTDVQFRSSSSKNPLAKFLQTLSKNRRYKKELKKIAEKESPDIIVSTFGYEKDSVADLSFKGKKILESHFTKNFRLFRGRKGVWGFIDRYKTRKDKRSLKRFDRFVCLTQEDKENWGNPDIAVINNFIENLTESPALLNSKKVVAVGRLSHQKGFDRLIEAWKRVNQRYPDWQLDIYGDGPLKDELQSQIDSLNLQDVVKLHGPVKDIHSKYLESSAFVMSSHYEGMPMAMLEAMEAGLPIISFDFECGPKDLITPGKNGLIVPNNDIEGLANAMMQVMEDGDLRSRMGKASFELAKSYTRDKIMDKWESLFSEILKPEA